MLTARCVRGPEYAELRPMRRSATSPTFPVYKDLTDVLVKATDPNDSVRHVLSVCSGYGYSDQATVAMMMTRLGLERSRCLMVQEVVDAMFISSTAYVIQSADGRVVIVCYRGTEPVNVVSWLTDLDIDPDQIRYDLTPSDPGDQRVHAGFYRNVRATRYAVIEVLSRALEARSIFPDEVRGDLDSDDAVLPLEALYVTGHSLGGALASLLTVMLRAEKPYAPLVATLKGTYTFGQPMIGTTDFAKACTQAQFGGADRPLHSSVFRYVYAADVVPQLPPRESGAFAHFGREFRCDRLDAGDVERPDWTERTSYTDQTGALGLAVGGFAFLSREIRRLRGLPLHQSIADHGPQNYISALTPPGVRSEYGD
jgi:hypothetical protein